MSPKCEHQYCLVSTLDGCHWYRNYFRCRNCDEQVIKEGERSGADEYFLMWLDATCRGCRDLAEKSGKSLTSLENYDLYVKELEEDSAV